MRAPRRSRRDAILQRHRRALDHPADLRGGPGRGSRVADSLYAPDELAGLPEGAVALALGVGNPVRHAGVGPGEIVLDIGCGAGIDTLIAARRAGPDGRAHGLDMTPAMLERARQHAALTGFPNVQGARDAGHEAEVFLAGEAVYLMKNVVTDAVLPVGMPALRELSDEVIAQRVPIFV